MKKIAAFLLATVLLFSFAGCNESSPMEGAGGGGGGTAIVQSQIEPESETSQKEDSGLMGKTLAYRTYAYKDNEALPIDYEFTAKKVQIFDNYQEAGIPNEEFMEQYTTDREFVLVDIRIKKTAMTNVMADGRARKTGFPGCGTKDGSPAALFLCPPYHSPVFTG